MSRVVEYHWMMKNEVEKTTLEVVVVVFVKRQQQPEDLDLNYFDFDI